MALMWSSLSALFVLAIWGMSVYLYRQGISFNAGQWLIYVLWCLWVLWSTAFVWTSLHEGERRAAKVGAMIFGGIAAVSGGVLAWSWFA